MDAQIVIDLQTGTPPYEQVQTQISSLIAVGQLPAGTRLPTIRSLAADLGVAAGTVARAYKELEAAGLVTTNRRQGTVVAEGLLPQGAPADERNPGATAAHPPPPPPVTNALGVMAAVEHLIEEGERAGLDGKTLISLLRGRLAQGK